MSRQRERGSLALRAQRARQMAGQPTYGFFGDVLRGVGRVATSIIPGPVDDILFGAISGQTGKRNISARSDCPPGFRANPRTGACEVEGPIGAVQRFLPGGQTGTLPQVQIGQEMPDAFGGAVMGAFGKPALQPAQASGVSLRCPRGMVLGKDNLCYGKNQINAGDRKWRPSKRAKISAAEWRTLSKANSVKNKAKEVASAAGFSCRKK